MFLFIVFQHGAAPSVLQKWGNGKGENNNWISCERFCLMSGLSVSVGTTWWGD